MGLTLDSFHADHVSPLSHTALITKWNRSAELWLLTHGSMFYTSSTAAVSESQRLLALLINHPWHSSEVHVWSRSLRAYTLKIASHGVYSCELHSSVFDSQYNHCTIFFTRGECACKYWWVTMMQSSGALVKDPYIGYVPLAYSFL